MLLAVLEAHCNSSMVRNWADNFVEWVETFAIQYFQAGKALKASRVVLAILAGKALLVYFVVGFVGNWEADFVSS